MLDDDTGGVDGVSELREGGFPVNTPKALEWIWISAKWTPETELGTHNVMRRAHSMLRWGHFILRSGHLISQCKHSIL